ncbi:MAG: hypothetical protein RLZZ450_6828 [Pseudomonadota bacterium]|jgi:hypothetical protein
MTDGRYGVPSHVAARLAGAGVGLDERRIARLVARDRRLKQIEFVEGPTGFEHARWRRFVRRGRREPSRWSKRALRGPAKASAL